MSFGYQVLGFGSSTDRRIVGVIQQGNWETSAQTLTDTKAGDVIFAATGALFNNTDTSISGFTSIASNTATNQWTSNANAYVQGRISYKVLTGSETEIAALPSSSGGTYVQFRFAKKVTSVSTQDLATSKGNHSGNYGAVSGTHAAVIRWLTQGAYGGGGAKTLSTGDPQIAQSGDYGGTLITESVESGSFSMEGVIFGGEAYFVTAICND